MREIDFRRDLLPLKDRLFRLALRIAQNREEAEDLTQDTLLRAWSRRGELAQVDSVEAYCLTVCRNLALDLVARKERQNISYEDGGADEMPDATPKPDEMLEYDERLRSVHRIFQALPERMRTAMQLRDIEGLSYQEAAQAMGITEALFKVTLHRARKAVKAEYEKRNPHGL